MSQMRLYVDEDAQRTSFITALRQANLELVTVSEAERLGLPDEQQLQWATEQGLVLYSFNVRDFSQLHNRWLAEGKTHPGIIVVPSQRYSINEQLQGLLKIIDRYSAETLIDQLLFLSNYL